MYHQGHPNSDLKCLLGFNRNVDIFFISVLSLESLLLFLAFLMFFKIIHNISKWETICNFVFVRV